MATTITQFPKFTYVPVGQDIIFIASNLAILTTPDFINVKYIAEVHISDGSAVNPASNIDVVGTFKTTPNNAGVGIFNFRSIVESYLNTDNKARANSSFKEVLNTDLRTPLHLIDKFSGNNNSFRYLFVKFKVEYIDNDSSSATFGDLITTGIANSNSYKLFNAYLKYSDELQITNDSFGYNLSQFNLTYNNTTKSLLTNAPSTQYANIEDYGTVAMLNIAPVFKSPSGGLNPGVRYIVFTFLLKDGSTVNDGIDIVDTADGGFDYTQQGEAYNKILYAGVFPANLRGWSTVFNANIDNIVSYVFDVRSYLGAVAAPASKLYTVNINCPTLKGYEPIRLTWLNQWGAWDYYTFNMKSIKNISTKGSTYQQLEGTWNESSYKLDGFRGGKKAFRVNATEKITMNTDFVSETESEWFEELINSPEVYILKGFGETVSVALTFEVEKSKTLRTQSV